MSPYPNLKFYIIHHGKFSFTRGNCPTQIWKNGHNEIMRDDIVIMYFYTFNCPCMYTKLCFMHTRNYRVPASNGKPRKNSELFPVGEFRNVTRKLGKDQGFFFDQGMIRKWSNYFTCEVWKLFGFFFRVIVWLKDQFHIEKKMCFWAQKKVGELLWRKKVETLKLTWPVLHTWKQTGLNWL